MYNCGVRPTRNRLIVDCPRRPPRHWKLQEEWAGQGQSGKRLARTLRGAPTLGTSGILDALDFSKVAFGFT